MSQLDDIAASSARGSFTLFIGNSVSLIVSGVGTILVARLLSPSEYGLYGVSIVLPNLFLLFSSWGVDPALTRFIARYRSDGEIWRIRWLERAGFLFKVFMGGALSLALFLSADVLAAVLLRRPEAGDFVRMASMLVLSQSLYSTVISVLAGLERMDFRSAVQIIEASIKGVSSPLLVYMGFGVSGAVIGKVSGFLGATLVGIFFTFSSSSDVGTLDERSITFLDSLKLMWGFGMPLFLGGLVSGFAIRLRGFLLSWFVSNEVFGNYSVSSRFVYLVGIVTQSISVTLFPAFSRFSYVRDPEKMREVFKGSIRYSTFVVIPLSVLLMVVSKPVIYTLFTAKYPQSPFYFSLQLVPILLVGIGSLSISHFLNSQGDTETNMKKVLTGSILSIMIAPFFIWVWGVFGLILSTIISRIGENVFGLYMLYRNYGVYPDLRHTMKTLLCSIISAGVSYGLVRLLSAPTPFISLIISSAIFVAVYLVIAPVIGAVEEHDIWNLDSMLRGLWVIYPFARLLLDFEERMRGLNSRKRTKKKF